MSTQSLGRVILVGAGPGNPDLVTVRAIRALRCADAVVYDALAATELLAEAPPNALRIAVGKRGHDDPTRSQPETTALLLSLAREGKTVVRLKGGDPYVFGRGGEEASACAEAGIDCEVVPGVSSVIGALSYAGIPVTDRRYAASFAVVTGHKDPTKVSEEIRWAALGEAVDTLVILMGMRNLERLVDRILAGGRSPDTPSAVVMNGTLPDQRVVEAPLGELVARVREAGVAAPAVIVIGDVVRLRETLAWYEARPLFGARVLVTRDARRAGELMTALRDAGAQARLLPMIALVPVTDPAPIDTALDELENYDALVFTSANAVRFFADHATRRGISLEKFPGRVACVGPSTAAAALAAGLPVHRMPHGRYDAEGLLAELGKSLPPAGLRFLFPCSDVARDVLPRGLRSAGATVDAVPVYRNTAPESDGQALRDSLVRGELDALTFASPSAAQRFAALLDPPALAAARNCLVVAVGSVTAEALRNLGLDPDVTADRPAVADLVAILAEHLGPERAGGTV